MKRRTFLLAALVTACSATPPAIVPNQANGPDYTAPKTTPTDVASVVASSNQFAMAMFAQLRDRSGNLAFSPASISLALNMTRAGARGETASQMESTLRVTLDDDRAHAANGNLLHGWNSGGKSYTLSVANRLFGEKSMSFEAPFLETTRNHYGAELEPLSFTTAADAARDKINDWVSQRTAKRIRNLLPKGSLDKSTRLVLTNAVYFKGKWAVAFDEENTRDATFHAPTGDTTVPMMHLTSELPLAKFDGGKLLELPYKGDDLVMTLIAPDAVDGIDAIESSLTNETLEDWLASAHNQEVDVALPRFEIDPPKPVKLKPMLISLGMADAFDADRSDFSGIADPSTNGRLVIDEAFHKAFVQVNEEGTEAAGATGVLISKAASVEKRYTFAADRPFLFLIRDKKSGAILFMGRVENPKS